MKNCTGVPLRTPTGGGCARQNHALHWRRAREELQAAQAEREQEAEVARDQIAALLQQNAHLDRQLNDKGVRARAFASA